MIFLLQFLANFHVFKIHSKINIQNSKIFLINFKLKMKKK